MKYPPFSHNTKNTFKGVQYPLPAQLKVASSLAMDEIEEVIRLYYTEGTPQIFFKDPILFERIRSWLAENLNVPPKCISITGSARTGYTMNPSKIIGTAFEEKVSDYDLFIVDEVLFKKLAKDFYLFVENVKNGIVRNSDITERYINNIIDIKKSIPKGYIDQKKLLGNSNYPTVQRLYSVLRGMLNRIGNTADCPQPKNASFRVFSDWRSCIETMTISAYYSFKKIK